MFHFVPGARTESAFVLCTGTSGLLAIIQPSVYVVDYFDFGRLVRSTGGEPHHHLGEYCTH